MLRITTVLVCCALASGCVSTGVYPDGWAERARTQSGDCPDIDGEYQSHGELVYRAGSGQPEFRSVGLAHVLSDDLDPSEAAVDVYEKVELELSDKNLRIVTTGADGSTTSFERPVLRCRNSMVVVDVDWTHSIEEEGGAEVLGATLLMVHGFTRESFLLGRAEDGSLLVRKSLGGSLMFYWMPVFPFYAADWMRFPAVAARAQEMLSATAPLQ